MNFESSREIERKRLEKKQVREHLLSEAKRKYDIEEHKIAAAKARGEDQWMLPELSQQIDERSKKLKKKTKKLKKEKKSKSEKKSKKKKKSSRSSSDSEASSDDQWVEKGKNVETPVAMDTNNAATHTDKPVKGPVLQRDDWMTLDAVNIPTVSRQELREKIKQDKLQYADEKGQKELNIDEAGTHEKELNPYWKGGSGSGLPEEVKAAIAVPKHSLAFLKKAYTRCEQEAEERGESLEDVVSQRYGSLEQLETMIMEAERAEELAKASAGERERAGPQARHDNRRKGYLDRHGRRYARSRSDSQDRGRRGRRSRSRSRSRDRRRRSRSRDGERRRSRSRDRERRRSRSRDRERRRSRSREKSRRHRSSSNSRSRSGDRQRHGHTREPIKSGSRFMKPGDADDQQSTLEKSRRGFLKPGETSEASRGNAEVKAASQPSWRKPGHQPAQKSRAEPAQRKVSRSPSTSSDSSSEQGADDSDSMSEPETPAPAVPLTDDEMNALGAKLLRAELMGNDDMVKEIKNKMEAARQLRNSGVAPPVKDEKEKVVMLSSADKFGNVRPVQTPREAGRGGKRRRAKKVGTHDKKGERERYFADDDRFNIKDMVQAEKMTSAEDHHMTFSKMAAKVKEKIDDDNQIDDAMINRARLEHDPDKMAAMQRQQAHADSKKLAQTLEDCQHCLENMTKHLIIAVHKNTYLCVPAHQSLNEGHCKIVPIHHCISSTSCDEDVWNEMQEFRRALVQMFTDNDDQDCVFMECSKNLRKHPHMVIECIPIERELGDLAPIYFKKAIDESEKEWAQNKKLVDLSKKDIRHSVPKGFPYFAIDFGLQGGYAHVIEDEHNFPAYFGKEVLGGMMDVDSGLWRKPKKEAFEQQRKKVVEFAKMFKPYDFTRNMTHSDSG